MLDKIKLQKSVADTVLSKLELLDRYCIVAGGAARDWYLNKPATDIDVYLHVPYLPVDKLRKILNGFDFTIYSSHEHWLIPELYEGNKCVQHLYNTEYLGEKVQIIFVSKPTFISVVDTFPISISKAWYKTSKGIVVTEDFKNSVKYKILWKTVDLYSETNKYLTKIKNKFSNYKYVTKEEAVKIIAEGDKDEQIKHLKEQVKLLQHELRRHKDPLWSDW